MLKASSWRNRLLGAAALLPALYGASAFAAAPPTGATDVGEVVVTATRQSQNLSKVPESVSAFTTVKMQVLNIKSFADVARYTPGVTFDDSRHDIAIRGISSQAGSGTTGIYIDDTPIQMRALGLNANNTLPAVFDLDRVEVLRGPQGTLFGAGSEGGTIRYITPQPSLTHFSAFAHTEVSFTQGGAPSYEAGAAIGGPLVEDKLGFRASIWARRDGGWIDRVDFNSLKATDKDANRVDTWEGRIAFLWQPTTNLSITPSFYYQKRDQHNYDNYWVSISAPSRDRYLNGTPDRQADPDRFFLPALKIEYDAGPVKLISNTSYFDRLERVNGYSGTLYNLSYFQQITAGATNPMGEDCSTDACTTGAPLLTPTGPALPGFGPYVSSNLITNSQQNFTQEFRIQSSDPNARFNWVAGVFYANNTQRSIEEIRDPQLGALSRYLWGDSPDSLPADSDAAKDEAALLYHWGEDLLPNGDDYINDTTSHDWQAAVFADGTFSITDQWKVTAGVRYAWTHFDFRNMNDGAQDLLCSAPGTDPGPNCGPDFESGAKDETPLTPKVGTSFQITPDDMVYATVSKGYRIGGASPPLPEQACGGVFPTSYQSDSVMNYEIGTKDRFLDRKLQVSASAFYIQWKNIQQAIYVPQCGIQYTTNVGNAVSQGFDFQAQWQPIHGLQLEASVGYTDVFYTGEAIEKISGAILAQKGDGPDVVPWTVTLGAQYNFSLADHDAFVRADYEYNSQRWRHTPGEDTNTDFGDPFLVPNPATNLVSMRAGVTLAKLDLAIFVDNLFDAHPRLDLTHEDSGTELFEATTFRPRTVGLSASYKY
jgi:iron complex outermembrane receptor protein